MIPEYAGHPDGADKSRSMMTRKELTGRYAEKMGIPLRISIFTIASGSFVCGDCAADLLPLLSRPDKDERFKLMILPYMSWKRQLGKSSHIPIFKGGENATGPILLDHKIALITGASRGSARPSQKRWPLTAPR